MKNRIPLILACLLLISCRHIGDATAADTAGRGKSPDMDRELSEGECIELGLKNNSGIKASSDQKDIAYSKVRYEKSMYYPQFSFRYDGGGTNSNFLLLEGTPAVITQPTHTPQNNFSKLFYNYEGRVNLPLVGDGVLGFWSHKVSRANYSLEQAGFQLDVSKRDTVSTIKEYFISVQKAQLEQEIQKESVSQYQDILRLVKEKFARGLASMKDVLQAESNLAQAEADLASWQHDYERTLKQLFMAIKVPTTNRLRVAPPDKTLAPLQPWDQVVGKITNLNLDLKAKKLDIDIAREDLKLSKNKLWPTVDLVGRYLGYQADRQDFQNVYAAYASIRLPLFELPLYRDISTKKLNVTLAKDNYQVSTESTLRAATDQYKELQDIPPQLKSFSKQIQYLEENFREYQAKYRQNLVSLIDLNNTLLQLNTAKKGETELYFKYKSGYQKLLNFMGEDAVTQGTKDTVGMRLSSPKEKTF
jgi:outer membrane protein TolC